jgi:hypothetical protein
VVSQATAITIGGFNTFGFPNYDRVVSQATLSPLVVSIPLDFKLHEWKLEQ